MDPLTIPPSEVSPESFPSFSYPDKVMKRLNEPHSGDGELGYFIAVVLMAAVEWILLRMTFTEGWVPWWILECDASIKEKKLLPPS